MKKIGKLYGIDAIIFAEVIDNAIDWIANATINVKAIDTETGILLYASEFPIDEKYMKTAIDDYVSKMTKSILNNKNNIKRNAINTIAFWQIEDSRGSLISNIVINKLTDELVNSGEFNIIDRDNLSELLKEQTFGTTGLVDPITAKRLGKLYGVDAFIFGRIKNYTIENDEEYISVNIDANLKMIDVNSAKIVWADETTGKYYSNKSDLYEYFGEKPLPSPAAEPFENKVITPDWITPTIRSAIWPGWGQRYNNQKEKGNAQSTIFFISALGAIGFKNSSDEQYKKYLNATNQSDIDTYYTKADDYYKYYQVCLSIAIIDWLLSINDARINARLPDLGFQILPDVEGYKIAWGLNF